MSIVNVGRTSSAWTSTRYIFFGSGPEATENMRTGTVRAPLFMSDLASDPADILRATGALACGLRAQGRSVEAYTLIHAFSPTELDINNPEHRELALSLAYQLAEEAYPGALKTVAVHVDSKGGHLHTHTVVINDQEGKCIRDNRLHAQVARLNDDLMTRHGLEVASRARDRESEATMYARDRIAEGKGTQADEEAITSEQTLKGLLREVRDSPDTQSLEDYEEGLLSRGVTVRKTKDKKRIISYQMGDFKRRASKLGTDYETKGVSELIAQRVAQQASEALRRAEEARQAQEAEERRLEAERASQRAMEAEQQAQELAREKYLRFRENVKKQAREIYPPAFGYDYYAKRSQYLERAINNLMKARPELQPIHEAEEARRAEEQRQARMRYLAEQQAEQAQASEDYGYSL